MAAEDILTTRFPGSRRTLLIHAFFLQVGSLFLNTVIASDGRDMTQTLRLVAWNVNHRSVRKPIRKTMPAAILALKPDIVILTEYIQHDKALGHRYLCDGLRDGGLDNVAVSSYSDRGDNQVLIASRVPADPRLLKPDPPALPWAAANALHVRLPAFDIEVVGIRAPLYSSATESRIYWDWFEDLAGSLSGSRTIIVGDLNEDPERPRTAWRGDCLRRIAEAGWITSRPEGQWSYWSENSQRGTRIDHAFVSGTLNVVNAAYVSKHADFEFAGSPVAMSDHAPLVLDVAGLPAL